MTVLITGGAGFIGSRLALALVARGERVVILDNFNDYYDPALKRNNVATLMSDPHATVIEGDVRDPGLITSIMSQHNIDRVAHMAAMAGVRYSVEHPELYYDINLNGSLNLLNAARSHGVRQFVLASTSSVYGQTTRIPFVEEDSADRPLAPYPASKRAAEMLAHTYYHLFGLNVTCLRFFNVYGPAGRPDMMPMRIMRAMREPQPITLYAGGALSRDWTYIDDILDGVLAALDRPMGYEVINLGCGAPISMTEFVAIIEELSGERVERINAPAPPSEPTITFCDNSRARRLLGFDPRVQVREGLARTWAWFNSR